MIPLQPVSAKFNDEERAKLKALAVILGWSESQVIRDSVAAIHFMVHNPEEAQAVKMIAMARQAVHFKQVVKNDH